MNKLLNQKEFANYQQALELMKTHCPEMLSRKIPEATIQQAFTLQTALDFIQSPKDKILSAGSWEDTATEALKKLGYYVIDVDPAINYDLKTYYDKHSQDHGTFDVIVSTSVIEHVANDEEFIYVIGKLLKSGGVGIVTMDYNNEYTYGSPKPNEDYRLYTEDDLRGRLNDVLTTIDCELLPADYTGTNDFCYAGNWYTFATFVFKKK